MTAPPLAPAPPRFVVWTVAVLAFLYYLTPIAAAVVADRSLPADIITRLVLGGVVGLLSGLFGVGGGFQFCQVRVHATDASATGGTGCLSIRVKAPSLGAR